ncbi:MAG: putative selenium-dependent hydroxylase accessory protein YqeC [Spirochaetaceae bacterium]|jgi:probable selenium-dependent hydroxylase accessory protein YqeC|nr:putative selenium-dependent hydroxylase accessory protein YqeC [Spirochaetaceae bacterium]
MLKLTDYFGAFGAQVTTLIGCGGKTSALWTLAESKRAYRTLVTTTTHTSPRSDSDACYDCALGTFMPRLHYDKGVHYAEAEKGITFIYKALPLDALEQCIPHYEYVFIEGDGSRSLPLKAWADYEPVVTASTNITVGILPLWTLGMPITESIVHRLPLFLELSGAKHGDTLALKHLAALIVGNGTQGGLFKAARGKKILFFNQVEDDRTLDSARELVEMLPEDFKRTLHGIIAGSVQNDSIVVLR